MKTLSVDNNLDKNLKLVKDLDGIGSGLEISTEGVRVKDIEIEGTAVVSSAPVVSNQIATKQYVDDNAGGGGSDNVVFGPFTARVGSINSDTKFWMAGTYGLNYPFWSSSNDLTDRDHGWSDSNEYGMATRVIHVPYDGTLKGMTGTFYSAGANTYLFEIWKATPSYPTSTVSDLVFSDTALDITTSGADSYKMKEFSKTDGSVSVSAGDVLAIYISRASGSASAYIYISLNILMEKS